MNKAKIDNRIYEVIDNTKEYFDNEEMYSNIPTAIKIGEILYPIRIGKVQSEPGIYSVPGACMSRIVEPTPEQYHEYSAENMIDFRSSSTREFIEKSNKLKNLERDILVNIDNVYVPVIKEDDSPEMKALKEAVIAKKIDIDKYKCRMGVNFQNDKRLFSKPTITLAKLKALCDVLDIKITLTLSDKDSTVPNPIGKVIEIENIVGEDEE